MSTSVGPPSGTSMLFPMVDSRNIVVSLSMGMKEFKRLMHLCTGTWAKEDTHGFEFQFLKMYQKANVILLEDAEENKKAKQCKKNAQVAQESDDEEEEEDDFSVLSEGAGDDDSDEEEAVDVVIEE